MLTNRLFICLSHPPNAEEMRFFEGGNSGEGSFGSGSGKGDEDPGFPKSKLVEDFSTKGEKKGEAAEKDKKSGEDKGKGEQVMSDEDFYYQGEHDDFDAFNIQEELPGVNESEQEALFDE